MGNRDPRYDLIKPMLSEGTIISFTDIFKYIPKTIVANDLGKKVDRFTVMMNDPKKFAISDVYKMGDLFKIGVMKLYELIDNEYLPQPQRERENNLHS